MIPKVIHQIWVGPNPLPEQHRRWMNTWQVLHPGWKHVFWDNAKVEAELFPLAHQRIYDECGCYGARGDILRIEVLLRHGGVYVDTDFECVLNLDPFIDRDILLARQYVDRIGFAVVGATPANPFIQHLADFLPFMYERHRAPGRNVTYSTSIALVNSCYAGWEPKFDIVDDPRVFFPHEASKPACRTFDNTVAIHHAAESWHLPGNAMVRYSEVSS